MKEISINLDAKPIKVAADALSTQLARLGNVLADAPLDHPAQLFELPVGDLFEALCKADMLFAVTKGEVLQIVPHPALVNFAGLIGAICDALEEKARELGATGNEAARAELNVARDKALAERGGGNG